MFQLFVFNKGLVASELATGVKAAKVVSKLIVSSIYLLWVHTFKRCALCLDNCLVFFRYLTYSQAANMRSTGVYGDLLQYSIVFK